MSRRVLVHLIRWFMHWTRGSTVISLVLGRWSKNIGLAVEICCYLNFGMLIIPKWLTVPSRGSRICLVFLHEETCQKWTKTKKCSFPFFLWNQIICLSKATADQSIKFVTCFCSSFSFWSSSADLKEIDCISGLIVDLLAHPEKAPIHHLAAYLCQLKMSQHSFEL